MHKYVILLAVVGTALGSSFGSRRMAVDREPIDNSDVFDCSGLADLPLREHPTDCTRFIQCTNGRTVDQPCADCDNNNIKQCQGSDYTVFDASVNDTACIWPEDSVKCGGGSITPTTTKRPTDPTSTETSVPGCQANNCTVDVTCDGYSFCERIDQTGDPDLIDDGQVVTVVCGPGLWSVGFPTENSNGDDVIGACLPWSELPDERKEEILRECIKTKPCELIAIGGPCTSRYQYRNNDGTLSTEKTCPSGHIVDLVKRGCVAGTC